MMGADLQATREQQRRAELYGMDMQRVTAANEALAAERQRRQQGLGQLLGYGIMGLSKGAFGDFSGGTGTGTGTGTGGGTGGGTGQ
jgi:hypothetical protein